MLIYFKEDEVVINTENISSIEYITRSYNPRPCLLFSVNSSLKDVDIFFPTKDDALKTLNTILTAYNIQQKVLIIYSKEQPKIGVCTKKGE